MDVRRLIESIAGEQRRLLDVRFVAPCVRGGAVRTRVAGLVRSFAPEPRAFEGWGIFQPSGERTVRVVEEASLPLVERYLSAFRAVRVRLARRLRDRVWMAYPANESDARQRTGSARPVVVHLVSEGAAFEQVVARWDGSAWWFDEVDRRADPAHAERLREAAREAVSAEALRIPGMTPEMRTAYAIGVAPKEAPAQAERPRRRGPEPTPERRLAEALRMGGGSLVDFREQGDAWLVEWATGDGERHTSAISKEDLTVVSAGICLAGYDRNFDLQSLVGVVEGADW